ncbi:glycosyltransferase [Lacibacter luteus]|uniref:Glycosyltransferase n=1 Tax=Lacibacter luteus TaxID=2508719 RepID=A0A4Q1CIS3_9BACT|nr:glycosyltransferase [Lacibacter luteus]RXK60025.1 glycosyltransferase [Lacibacter luteus]
MMLDFYLLIPCYNNVEGLIRSLRSVVYPKGKCRILLVDDGSTVPVTMELLPEDVLQRLQIEIIRFNENKGITEALNTGLRLILQRNDALYTARLDCGDVCREERFEKQVKFLNENTYMSLLGSLCLFVDPVKKIRFVYKAAEKHYVIRKQMHLKCSFIHPTVMYRNESLKQTALYPYNFPYAEDYAFFFELMKKFQTHILQEMLVETEINTQGISAQKRRQQIKSKTKIIKHYGFNKLLTCVGLLRQYLLLLLPYKLITPIKRFIFPH